VLDSSLACGVCLLDSQLQCRIRIQLDSLARYFHRMAFGSSLDVFGDLDLRASSVWDFISDPVEDQDGDGPKSSDTQFRLGLGCSF
jgi:hypothetical protein